mmetsp:Transcript_12097/g.28683  ORF Transcript_12097/g.28683 Transcript_12097/m.28683 type:complete len:236 (-) Transcript_12097:600-1307(-)
MHSCEVAKRRLQTTSYLFTWVFLKYLLNTVPHGLQPSSYFLWVLSTAALDLTCISSRVEVTASAISSAGISLSCCSIFFSDGVLSWPNFRLPCTDPMSFASSAGSTSFMTIASGGLICMLTWMYRTRLRTAVWRAVLSSRHARDLWSSSSLSFAPRRRISSMHGLLFMRFMSAPAAWKGTSKLPSPGGARSGRSARMPPAMRICSLARLSTARFWRKSVALILAAGQSSSPFRRI